MHTLTLYDTGHCVVSEHQVLRGGARRPLEIHALAALLEHPRHGATLFDTGYAMRMLDATERWPYRLYRRMTPLRLRPELELAGQLEQRGVPPASIAQVIVSHFHADHVAGLHDFPGATLVATADALESVLGSSGFGALGRGYLPDLQPADLVARASPVYRFEGPPLPHLGPTHDLFGDGSLLLVPLPGHARGQVGALVETMEGPVLLAADGAWTSRSIRERLPPAAVTRLIADDWDALVATLEALHAFSHSRPDVRILPCHCPEVYAAVAGAC